MNRKQFSIYGMLITGSMGALVGYSVSKGNIWLLLMATVGGVILLSLGKRKVTEVIEDERIYRISEKASRKVIEIFGIGAALLGVSLITMNRYTEAGYTLAFSACILMLLYLIFYGYYSRRALE